MSPVEAPPETVAPSAPRRRRRRVLVVVALLCVVAAVAWGAHRWTHPTLFDEQLNGTFEANPRPVAAGALSMTVVFPRSGAQPEPVTIESMEAEFATNSAEATASYWVCHRQTGADPVGAVNAPRQYCADVEPVDAGTVFRWGGTPGDYLYVTITPTRPGIARLTGVQIRYDRGADHLWQHGAEWVGVDGTVTAT